MTKFFQKRFGCTEGAISCSLSLLTSFVQRHAYLVLILSTAFTVWLMFYIVHNFRMNTNLDNMIDNSLPFRQVALDYDKAFENRETLVVVLDGDSAELSAHVQGLLANKLSQEKKMFHNVYLPGGGSFFEKNGLLYLSLEELQDLSDRVAQVQPLLGMVAQDMTLRGLFSMLERIFKESDDIEKYDDRFISMFTRLSEAFNAVTSKEPIKPYHLSWQALMFGEKQEDTRRFIVVEPNLDYSEFYAGQNAVETVSDLAVELKQKYGVQVRITGSVALENDDLISVQKGTVLASLLSLVLLRIILSMGLGSARLIVATLLTLLIGLIWTTGFAIVFIGSLNLISISFAVLFIGLGSDFSLQYCMRYMELIEEGNSNEVSLVKTATSTGSSLFLCALTAAVGFYSFVPTAFSGVSELGIISGTGMFISIITNFTFMPALLAVMPLKNQRAAPLRFNQAISLLPYKYAKSISIFALVLGIGSALLLPRIYFDYNPLNLNNPDAESVKTAKELFKSGNTSPWKISLLAANEEEAKAIKDQLNSLEEVERAITLTDFVPDDQQEKLSIIEELGFFIPQIPEKPRKQPPTFEDNMAALKSLGELLRTLILFTPRIDDSEKLLVMKRFYYSILSLQSMAEHSRARAEFALEQLNQSLLLNLSLVLKQLGSSLNAEPFEKDDLPQDLRRRYVAEDGRYRIEVSPKQDINKIENLEVFVAAVRTVAPNATDSPVMILESGKAIIGAFKEATVYAIIVITIIILIMLRSLSETVFVLIPLTLAVVYTGAVSVLLDIPLNFANVIVVPLILGVAVDLGIHFVHRFHTDPPARGNILMTSTARGVFYSALTNLVSFGSLAFSAHKGTASMGLLLVLCMSFMLFSTLIVLPALLKLFKGHRGYPVHTVVDEWVQN
jgi:hopanoid biosynthesis associated RND transporter like protein HpnN